MIASVIPSGRVGDVEIDGENEEGKRTENGQDLGKNRLRTIDEGSNLKEALSQSDEDRTEEDNN